MPEAGGEPHKQAGHMTAPSSVAKNVEFPLQRRGRPHMGARATRLIVKARCHKIHATKSFACRTYCFVD